MSAQPYPAGDGLAGYRRRTLAAGTDGEALEQAFDDLVQWIERGIKPDGDDLLALASGASKLGLRWTAILHPDDPARRR